MEQYITPAAGFQRKQAFFPQNHTEKHGETENTELLFQNILYYVQLSWKTTKINFFYIPSVSSVSPRSPCEAIPKNSPIKPHGVHGETENTDNSK